MKDNLCYPLLAKSKEAIIVSKIPVRQSYDSYVKLIS